MPSIKRWCCVRGQDQKDEDDVLVKVSGKVQPGGLLRCFGSFRVRKWLQQQKVHQKQGDLQCDQAAVDGCEGSLRSRDTTSKHSPSDHVDPGLIKQSCSHAETLSSLSSNVNSKNVSACPYGHGTVSAHPYPGYVHGRHPQVCPNGCEPDIQVKLNGRKDETVRDILIREAVEYQNLYHKEKGSSEEVKTARIQEVLAEINATGTYVHTFDELQHGARVAWRNAPKCANRKFWEELCLIDRREVATEEDMLAACLELLEKATLSCVTTSNIVVFRPQTPGKDDGPRVWNSQLLRYAGYTQPDGSVLGDKAEKDFTRMLFHTLSWETPALNKRTEFDILPLILQANPARPPKVFQIPPYYIPRVHMTHPDYPQFASLGLQWYAIPAVSNIDLSVGGVTYTACPFNGWYSVTEVVRNLTDECRYNMCLPVAKTLGFNTKGEDTMWRDRTITEITVAVMHSFKEAGMGMVDHHTLIKNFHGWYEKELSQRGYCPGNWKWIIPPISSSTSRAYMELNKMTEYTLKPGYFHGPGWKSYVRRTLTEVPEFMHGASTSTSVDESLADSDNSMQAMPVDK